MKQKIILFLIILTAIFLRMYDIDQKNMWFDEVYSWHVSLGSTEEIIAAAAGDIHPPLYYLVLKYWMEVFSDSVFSMRMLSTLLCVLSIFFIYRISYLFINSENSVFAILLLYAVSPLNLYYSQEVRMLSLNLFLCLGSVYFFIMLIKSAEIKNGIFYILFTILSLYTHYFGFLIFFTEILILITLYFRKSLSNIQAKKLALYVIIINLLYLPWYPIFFRQTAKGQPWRHEQTFMNALRDTSDYFRDMFFSTYISFESRAMMLYAEVFSSALILLILYSIYKMRKSGMKLFSENNYVILFFFVPLLTAFLVTLKQSILLSRYLSILVPYFLMSLIFFIKADFDKKPMIAVYLIILFTSLTGVYIYSDNKFKNNDYRKIISYIESNYSDGDEIIAEPHFMGWSLNYHIKHQESRLKEPSVLGWNLGMQIDSLKKSENVNKIWFITDYSSLDKDNYDSLPEMMDRIGYSNLSSKTFYVIPAKVRVDYFAKK